MRLFRLAAFGLMATVLAVLGNADAQVFQKGQFDKFKGKTPTTSSPDLLTAPLYPADVIAKLKLNAEQKPQVDKLLAEFNTKLKEIAAKVPAANPGTPADKFKGFKGKGGNVGQASPQFAAVLNLQSEYEKKVAEILTIDQRKLLDELTAKAGPGLK